MNHSSLRIRGLLAIVLLMGWVFLQGCSDRSVPEKSAATPADTSGASPSVGIGAEAVARDADTTHSKAVLSLYNERHLLTITGIGRGGSNFDRTYRIQLTNDAGPVVDTVLTKFSFADSLHPDFLSEAGLYLFEFDFVRAQSLHFNAMVGVDETDNVQPIDLVLTYAGPRKGRIHYWLVPEMESGWD